MVHKKLTPLPTQYIYTTTSSLGSASSPISWGSANQTAIFLPTTYTSSNLIHGCVLTYNISFIHNDGVENVYPQSRTLGLNSTSLIRARPGIATWYPPAILNTEGYSVIYPQFGAFDGTIDYGGNSGGYVSNTTVQSQHQRILNSTEVVLLIYGSGSTPVINFWEEVSVSTFVQSGGGDNTTIYVSVLDAFYGSVTISLY